MNAGVAELADALDLGSSGRPCRFNSCHPHAGQIMASYKKSRQTLINQGLAALLRCVSYEINKMYPIDWTD